jgi:hypothetical protein
MNLMHVTLTGADNSVQPEQLAELSVKYPFVEWAILFSKTRSGTPRYPSWDWIVSLSKLVVSERNKLNIMSLSAHLCGGWVDDVLKGDFTFLRDVSFANVFDRIQLNMGKDRLEKAFSNDLLLKAVKSATDHRVIFGGNYSSVSVDEDFLYANYISPLFDASGGKGVETKEWPKPLNGQEGIRIAHGYAGGLGPDNVAEELKRIKEVADNEIVTDRVIWIDMETKLRTKTQLEDKFDLEKCEQVLQACLPWVR